MSKDSSVDALVKPIQDINISQERQDNFHPPRQSQPQPVAETQQSSLVSSATNISVPAPVVPVPSFNHPVAPQNISQPMVSSAQSLSLSMPSMSSLQSETPEIVSTPSFPPPIIPMNSINSTNGSQSIISSAPTPSILMPTISSTEFGSSPIVSTPSLPPPIVPIVAAANTNTFNLSNTSQPLIKPSFDEFDDEYKEPSTPSLPPPPAPVPLHGETNVINNSFDQFSGDFYRQAPSFDAFNPSIVSTPPSLPPPPPIISYQDPVPQVPMPSVNSQVPEVNNKPKVIPSGFDAFDYVDDITSANVSSEPVVVPPQILFPSKAPVAAVSKSTDIAFDAFDLAKIPKPVSQVSKLAPVPPPQTNMGIPLRDLLNVSQVPHSVQQVEHAQINEQSTSIVSQFSRDQTLTIAESFTPSVPEISPEIAFAIPPTIPPAAPFAPALNSQASMSFDAFENDKDHPPSSTHFDSFESMKPFLIPPTALDAFGFPVPANNFPSQPYQSNSFIDQDQFDIFESLPVPPKIAAPALPVASPRFDNFDDEDDMNDDIYVPKPYTSTQGGISAKPSHVPATKSIPAIDPDEAMKKLKQTYNIQTSTKISEPFDEWEDSPISRSQFGKTDTEESVHDGEIHARLSARSLFAKDWAVYYWYIDVNEGILSIYRSRADRQFQNRGAQPKKVIPITHNLKLLKIKPKEYKGFGILYNFMLEEIMDYGPVNVGKFAR